MGKFRDENLHGVFNHRCNLPFDSNLLISFYKSYPELKKYKKEVVEVYRQHKYTQIWYDDQGVVEFGYNLFSKARELNLEGVSSEFPYQAKIDGVFDNDRKYTLSQMETELMLTNLYLFYTEKVYKGLGDSTSMALGWLLPRKQVSYARLLDSVMSDPRMLNSDESVLFSQYYKLRDVLERYRNIERQRVWTTNDPESKKNILPEYLRKVNIPISERIKKIIVNMERCRWISPKFDSSKVYIVVNIPSFKLNLVRNGKIELESSVIVGTNLTKTVIFSGIMNQIVFSPYWIVPQSIIEEEVKPGIVKNKNYLRVHNMEWNKGKVRQKPGKNNSLGLVKFIFPNSDDIYIHDTPAKSLFSKDSRAFSHGCIRVAKPRALAVAILKDDQTWTPEKIDAAMHAGKEYTYMLKNKIPVYIGYLTAWVNEKGEINFYEDIYNRDERLTKLLIDEK